MQFFNRMVCSIACILISKAMMIWTWIDQPKQFRTLRPLLTAFICTCGGWSQSWLIHCQNGCHFLFIFLSPWSADVIFITWKPMAERIFFQYHFLAWTIIIWICFLNKLKSWLNSGQIAVISQSPSCSCILNYYYWHIAVISQRTILYLHKQCHRYLNVNAMNDS